jgi:hypothetical protein
MQFAIRLLKDEKVLNFALSGKSYRKRWKQVKSDYSNTHL